MGGNDGYITKKEYRRRLLFNVKVKIDVVIVAYCQGKKCLIRNEIEFNDIEQIKNYEIKYLNRQDTDKSLQD